ncbi:MAG TPA: hypothetical protein VL017_03445 [Devosia sp.]|nr:hypothetical protein [Devosia sp.]
MRRTTAVLHAQRPLPLSRGWIVVGAALASWALFIGLSATVGALFTSLLAAI